MEKFCRLPGTMRTTLFHGHCSTILRGRQRVPHIRFAWGVTNSGTIANATKCSHRMAGVCAGSGDSATLSRGNSRLPKYYAASDCSTPEETDIHSNTMDPHAFSTRRPARFRAMGSTNTNFVWIVASKTQSRSGVGSGGAAAPGVGWAGDLGSARGCKQACQRGPAARCCPQ